MFRPTKRIWAVQMTDFDNMQAPVENALSPAALRKALAKALAAVLVWLVGLASTIYLGSGPINLD